MKQLNSANFNAATSANLAHRLGSLDLFDRAAPLVPIGAWSCDLANDRLDWTDGVFDMFGLTRDDAPEREAAIERYSEESRELLERKRSQAIENRNGFTLDASILRPDGTERWIRITAATRGSNGRTEMLFGMKQDITDDRRRWDLLRAQAECDPLTGVANRYRFQRFLDQPASGPVLDDIGTLILFDIDDFKQINDRWGHAAGDACLVNLADHLRKAFVNAHSVSRIGGDEFAVLLPSSVSRAQTKAELQSLMARLLRPIRWNDCLLTMQVSVGFAFASRGGKYNPQTLFNTADEALYCSKNRKIFASD
ncbi:diguanylate cyclase domain-containing protein [Parasphingorhabdus sp.]|uniref:diguanylate cyclase domain-containing protein n=1 Tax=Parasphingorhabdus sp. TaxID=2709688 RepID=UPI003A8EC145